MANNSRNNRNGFALIFAAVLTAALAITVASITSSAGVMQQQAAARKWSVIARSLAEQGMSRALAEARAVAVVSGRPDMDWLLDPDKDDTTACAATGCTDTDNNYPSNAVVTVGASSYGGWGSATENFGGQGYRRVNSGSGAYLVRYDDNLDDFNTTPGYLQDTKDNTNGLVEGNGTDVPNRDRDQHIVVTSVGFAGGTTESTAKARYVIRALVRTLGGVTVRAGSYVDTGSNGDICGNGLQMCRSNGGAMPGCWCGELQIDDTNYSGAPPALPSSCSQCGSNCPPATFREVTGLCTALAPGPPKPPDYLTEIQKRSTYGTMVSSTATNKGKCLMRVDLNRSLNFSGNTAAFTANETVDLVIHLWDSSADANCATTSGDLPAPDFDFDTWTMGAGTAAKDCWVPVYMKVSNGCPYDVDSAGISGWITPDCRINPATDFINTTSYSCSGAGCDVCTGGNATASCGNCANPGTFCPGRAFGGVLNALDSITSSNSGGGANHTASGIHRPGGNHWRILGARPANTAAGAIGKSTTEAVNGLDGTGHTWASLCGCTDCGDTGAAMIDLDAETGTVTVDGNGPKGVYLVYQGNNNATLTVNNGAAATPAQTAVYFAGLSNITIPANTFLQGPGPSGPNNWALTNQGNCILGASNSSKTMFKDGLWCSGNIVMNNANDVHWLGSMTSGDDTQIGDISGGKNNNYYCAATVTACPNAASCTSTERGKYWATGNINISDNGGGTGPDVCMNIQAGLNLTVQSNSNNGWVSGTIWVGGNASGPRLQVDPGAGSMMGATPSVLSFQSFAF